MVLRFINGRSTIVSHGRKRVIKATSEVEVTQGWINKRRIKRET